MHLYKIYGMSIVFVIKFKTLFSVQEKKIHHKPFDVSDLTWNLILIDIHKLNLAARFWRIIDHRLRNNSPHMEIGRYTYSYFHLKSV